MPGISLRMAITNLETKIQNPTFHNSRDSRKEARRHLFMVVGPVETEQRTEKTEKRKKKMKVFLLMMWLGNFAKFCGEQRNWGCGMSQ